MKQRLQDSSRRCRLLWLAMSLFAAPMTAIAQPPAFTVCTDFHCDFTAEVAFSEEQWQDIRSVLPQATSAATERRNLQGAIGLMETFVGQLAGTSGDLARNKGGDEIGQLDCISESTNTTTYLHLLANAGLLHWHTVEERKRRNPWILDYHWTAVIRETVNGSDYAVDSWFLDNGAPPHIQSLEQWLAGKAFEQ